ncbi:lactococcin 972 family bacteriocin [Priestia megaterium]|jgi:hypothetical protein|uniref:lactococcin 972 family bacteriocin n=1 Tax=Priestia TaxID=2800373 RepID=UPI000BED202A|nr:lactococcin 972 family bacteriocin [Priestia megaterium]MED3854930.1 lactococcin 972 family bacteriocin [Priestia megaterium]PEB61101.1 hypothetical protein COM86_26255 [Priestia megaterium]PEE73307.1 hypothetical protein COM81_29180 [Priestia megaterium]PFI94189.1 hypothetical protein COI84_17310 [Priestia megaterium]PGR04390.1 hypothetical protein COC62_30225 [Priestia megaterium]
MIKKRILGISLIGMIALTAGGQSLAASSEVDHGEENLNNVAASTPNSTTVTALSTEKVGGGTWNRGWGFADYGKKKKAWSNYKHSKKIHKSSSQVGPYYDTSDWTAKGKTSTSSSKGGLLEDAHAWYDTITEDSKKK